MTARKPSRRVLPSHVRVEVRAVILLDGGRLVVRCEHQADGVHISLPGGRPKHGEGVLDALVREVREETGLVVRPGRLLYIAEANSGRAVHDVNLVFRATPGQHSLANARLDVLDVEDPAADALRPPLTEAIRQDIVSDWRRNPRWLGNLWDDDLGRRTSPPFVPGTRRR